MRTEYRDGRVYFYPGPNEIPFPRYNVMKGYCKGGIVADVACGSGYGTTILSKEAQYVHGYDVSAETIEFAKANWQRSNISFQLFDLEKDAFPIKYNCIISCETIEHVGRPLKETISLFRDALISKGVLGLTYPEREARLADFHKHFNIANEDISQIMLDLGFELLINEMKDGSSLMVGRLKT